MGNYGSKYNSSEDKRNARAAKRKQRDEQRVANRKIAKDQAEKLMREMANMIEESGFSRLKVSVYSGVCATTVTRIAQRRDPTSAPFYSIVGLCRALGYKVVFEKLPPEQDEFIEDRWIKATELLKKNDADEG